LAHCSIKNRRTLHTSEQFFYSPILLFNMFASTVVWYRVAYMYCALPVFYLVACLVCPFLLRGQTAVSYPPRMYADSLHAPFYLGVASGDPLPDRVIIWTHITPSNPDVTAVSVNWQVAADSLFTTILQSGAVFTSAQIDWTVKADVTALLPNNTYYYRFSDEEGNTSATGKTKTAPTGNVPVVKFAIASCSSIFSGYFNAYNQIAQLTDLNCVIHLGDYIYDSVDPDEQVRLPEPYPQGPQNLQQWRNRHAYYLLDPDLRAARQQHPWVAIWDNHDVERNDPADATGSRQAFWEYLPIRQPDTLQNQLIYRPFRFGNLVQLLLTDILLHRNESEIEPGIPSMLGQTQYNWLTNQLLNNPATWRVIGSQKMVGTWSIAGLPPIGFGDGDVADLNSWDGFPQERLRVLQFLANNNLQNNVFISGDAHVSRLVDLPLYPFDTLSYNPATGQGSVAVEMLPTSISRGNFDEAGLPATIVNAISTAFANLNPHEVFNQLTQHGYGLLSFTPDSLLAEIWYCPILTQSAAQTLGARWVCFSGQNHWRRTVTSVAAPPQPQITIGKDFTVYPNPASQTFYVKITAPFTTSQSLRLTDAQGKILISQTLMPGILHTPVALSVAHLPAGLYRIYWQEQPVTVVKW